MSLGSHRFRKYSPREEDRPSGFSADGTETETLLSLRMFITGRYVHVCWHWSPQDFGAPSRQARPDAKDDAELLNAAHAERCISMRVRDIIY
jgi:hypothetical protein